MVKSKVDFPYPVLYPNSEDYVEGCDFRISEFNNIFEDDSEIITHIKYDLDCDFLEGLIEEGKAVVVAYIKSPNSSYRTNVYFDEGNEKDVKINKSMISHKINIKPYIIARTPINNYKSNLFNKEFFGEESFEINKGDILAYEEQYDIIIDDIDELKSCASIFTIRLDEKSKESLKVDYHDQKINIIMNNDTYKTYRDLRERSEIRVFLSGIVVFPALVEVIEAMKREINDGTENIEDKRWYLSLEKQLKRKDIKLSGNESSVFVANEIIGDVVNNSMRELDNLIKLMSKQEESN